MVEAFKQPEEKLAQGTWRCISCELKNYDALDKEKCTNCFTARKREELHKEQQPREQAKEIAREPERVVPEEEIPLGQSQWRCKTCTFINTVEDWTDSFYASCQMCVKKDNAIFD